MYAQNTCNFSKLRCLYFKILKKKGFSMVPNTCGALLIQIWASSKVKLFYLLILTPENSIVWIYIHILGTGHILFSWSSSKIENLQKLVGKMSFISSNSTLKTFLQQCLAGAHSINLYLGQILSKGTSNAAFSFYCFFFHAFLWKQKQQTKHSLHLLWLMI